MTHLRKRRVIVRATMWMTNEAGQPQPHDMRTTCSSEQVTSGACRDRVRRGAVIFSCELEVEAHFFLQQPLSRIVYKKYFALIYCKELAL